MTERKDGQFEVLFSGDHTRVCFLGDDGIIDAQDVLDKLSSGEKKLCKYVEEVELKTKNNFQYKYYKSIEYLVKKNQNFIRKKWKQHLLK